VIEAVNVEFAGQNGIAGAQARLRPYRPLQRTWQPPKRDRVSNFALLFTRTMASRHRRARAQRQFNDSALSAGFKRELAISGVFMYRTAIGEIVVAQAPS
jgi:hypothetical protein